MTQATTVFEPKYTIVTRAINSEVIKIDPSVRPSDFTWIPEISVEQFETARRAGAFGLFTIVMVVLQLLIVGSASAATAAFQAGLIPLGVALIGPIVASVIGMAGLSFKLGKYAGERRK